MVTDPKFMKNKIYNYMRYYLPVLLWAMVVFLFSSYPTNQASEIHWQDFAIKKTAHMVEYAVFSILVFRALVNTGMERTSALKYALLFSVLYGTTDEYHQSFTPGREPHVRDIIFDTIGASLATYYIWKLLPKAPPRLKKWASDFQLI